jgi:hypothetical protein
MVSNAARVRLLPGEDIALVFDRSCLRSVNIVHCQLACYCKYLNVQCLMELFSVCTLGIMSGS